MKFELPHFYNEIFFFGPYSCHGSNNFLRDGRLLSLAELMLARFSSLDLKFSPVDVGRSRSPKDGHRI